jgi:hypothetical protein
MRKTFANVDTTPTPCTKAQKKYTDFCTGALQEHKNAVCEQKNLLNKCGEDCLKKRTETFLAQREIIKNTKSSAAEKAAAQLKLNAIPQRQIVEKLNNLNKITKNKLARKATLEGEIAKITPACTKPACAAGENFDKCPK